MKVYRRFLRPGRKPNPARWRLHSQPWRPACLDLLQPGILDVCAVDSLQILSSAGFNHVPLIRSSRASSSQLPDTENGRDQAANPNSDIDHQSPDCAGTGLATVGMEGLELLLAANQLRQPSVSSSQTQPNRALNMGRALLPPKV